MTDNKYKITCTPVKFTGSESFQFDTILEGYIDQVSRTIINLQEKRIREGLIALGWTPPPEDKD